MKHHQELLEVSTTGRGFFDVVGEGPGGRHRIGCDDRPLHHLLQHTSASLVIQENAAPSVQRDLERWMARLAPEDAKAYEHDDEGPDDMPAHLRSAVLRTNEVIPITAGRLALGTWQAI